MPEGDTVHLVARLLAPMLVGQELVQVVVRSHGRAGELAGSRATAVLARGKHLLVTLDRGWTVHVHLGMDGTWHQYAPGARWRRPADEAHVVLGTASTVNVCFRPKLAELLRTGDVGRTPVLALLGPDLLSDAVDWGEVERRVALVREAPVGEALLSQHVAAGIGNIYRAEVLFLHRLHPAQLVSASPEPVALWRTASRLLRDNLAAALEGRLARVTTDSLVPSRLNVYGRGGRPCPRCGARITTVGGPPRGRTCWFCPRCQPVP